VAVAILAMGCGETTGPEVGPDQAVLPATTEVTVGYGQEIEVPNSTLRLRFNRVVEDSRCPVNALILCVWEGNAVVEIGIAEGTRDLFPLQLNSTLNPRAAQWDGVIVTLEEVLPVPLDVEPIPPEQYSVRVKLEPVTG
jgi:hypothetical protein